MARQVTCPKCHLVFTAAQYNVHKFTHRRDEFVQKNPVDLPTSRLLPIEVPDDSDEAMEDMHEGPAPTTDYGPFPSNDPFSDNHENISNFLPHDNPFSDGHATAATPFPDTSHTFQPPVPSDEDINMNPLPGHSGDSSSPSPTSGCSSPPVDEELEFEDSGLDPAFSGHPSLSEQIKERFLADYHGGGKQFRMNISTSAHLLILIAKHLSEHDLDICLAYSFMVQAKLSTKEAQMLPRAFRDGNLVSPEHIQARARLLAGVEPELYDCCPGSNACMCFTGEHHDLTKCLVCNEARFNSKGLPRRRFTYIPLIPRLKAAAESHTLAEVMQYRAQYNHQPGVFGDVFDGENYRRLQDSPITVHGEVLKDNTGEPSGIKYFEDPRDVAIGLSTDGFTVHGFTFWPLIIFLYNLPPTIRFLLQNILALGVIPGKPVLVDTFLWPFLQEVWKLVSGILAFDALSSQNFILRAFLILILGDIPAIAMLMRMKGHNGISPCRACPIIATPLRRGTQVTYYVVSTFGDNAEWRTLRNHPTMMQQAKEVEDAPTKAQAETLAKKYGIKGKSILFTIDSILFPSSFPFDFMHLIWEGVVGTLIELWTGDFKGIDEGKEEYQIDLKQWKQVGSETAASGKTIPSSFGPRLPNIADSLSNISADMWSFWVLFIGPVVLQNRFRHPKYFKHFVNLVSLINICLQRKISREEIDGLEKGFENWVRDYQR